MAIYMDNSATTRPFDEVIDLMAEIMREHYGNASSLHRMGIDAEKYLDEARARVAAAFGVNAEEIIFTSGGTESDNTALLSGARAARRRGKKVITSCVEHPAILESLAVLEQEDFDTVQIPVDEKGVVDMERLLAEITDDTILISIMHVNNESGAIMPIEEIAKHKKNALFHVDMVQSFGKLQPVMAGVDMASISGHKIHGPKGIGALFVRKGTNLPAFMVGGGQERHLRSGTENIPAIAGLGLAAKMIYEDRDAKNAKLKEIKRYMAERFADELDGVLLNSHEDGAPHILNVTFEDTRGEVLLHMLEQEGIYVSTGSACSSNHNGRSHVITAMGRTPDQVDGTLRFSLCDANTMAQAEEAAEKTIACVKKFRKLGKFQ